jgi:stage V sporulation protein S
MNRFFSKLDLRDIKIDPQGSRFPPEEEETAEDDVQAAQVAESTPVVDEFEPTRQPDAPAWAEAPAPMPDPTNGYRPAEAVTETFDDERTEDGISPNGEVLKVSAKSRPSAVAGAIAGVVRESGRAEVQAIGAGATNQAVKAVAIARDYLRETGIEAICLPAFIDVTIDNEDRTAILLVVEPR